MRPRYYCPYPTPEEKESISVSLSRAARRLDMSPPKFIDEITKKMEAALQMSYPWTDDRLYSDVVAKKRPLPAVNMPSTSAKADETNFLPELGNASDSDEAWLMSDDDKKKDENPEKDDPESKIPGYIVKLDFKNCNYWCGCGKYHGGYATDEDESVNDDEDVTCIEILQLFFDEQGPYWTSVPAHYARYWGNPCHSRYNGIVMTTPMERPPLTWLCADLVKNLRDTKPQLYAAYNENYMEESVARQLQNEWNASQASALELCRKIYNDKIQKTMFLCEQQQRQMIDVNTSYEADDEYDNYEMDTVSVVIPMEEQIAHEDDSYDERLAHEKSARKAKRQRKMTMKALHREKKSEKKKNRVFKRYRSE